MSRSLLKLYKHENLLPYTLNNPCCEEMSGFISSLDDWKLYAEQALATGGVAGVGSIVLNGAGGSDNLPFVGTRVPSYIAYGANAAFASLINDIAERFALTMGVAGGWQELLIVAATSGGWMYYQYGQLEDAILGFISKLAGDKITRDVRASAGSMM